MTTTALDFFLALGDAIEPLKDHYGHTGDAHRGWSTRAGSYRNRYPSDDTIILCGCGDILELFPATPCTVGEAPRLLPNAP